MEDSTWYVYKIANIYAYDGDTITADIDLGFKITKREKLRLYGIDTPEIRGEEREEGLIVRDYVRDRIDKAIEENAMIWILSYKDKQGKYGRYLVELFIDGENINQTLINEGMAEPYMV